MELEDLRHDANNVVNIDTLLILERDNYDELITKATVTILTLMKIQNAAIKQRLLEGNFADTPESAGMFAELEMLEADYLEFEENLDAALTDDEIKAHLKEAARNILTKYMA